MNENRLPLDHAVAALEQAILKRLGVAKPSLLAFSVFKRSLDARKKDAMLFVYSVDVTLQDEAATLKKIRDGSVLASPDTSYHFVADVPASFTPAARPLVVGFGPCGIFAALILAQMGLKPIVIERGTVSVGKTIEALKLDDIGVQLTALRRKGVREARPAPEMRLDIGDTLVLAGTPDALAKAEIRLLQG